MSENKRNFKDLTIAHALSAGSYLPGATKINGSDSPNHISTRWHVAKEAANDIKGWVAFEPNRAAGRTPRQYPEAGVISVGYRDLEQFVDYFDEAEREAKYAVAYKLGTAVMVGTMPEDQTFGRSTDRYQVAMRIGSGVLEATAGVWLPDSRSLVVPQDGARADGRMPVSEVPQSIPLF